MKKILSMLKVFWVEFIKELWVFRSDCCEARITIYKGDSYCENCNKLVYSSCCQANVKYLGSRPICTNCNVQLWPSGEKPQNV